MSRTLYIVTFYDSVEPELVGPFNSDTERIEAAKGIMERSQNCCCRLTIVNNNPIIESFGFKELE